MNNLNFAKRMGKSVRWGQQLLVIHSGDRHLDDEENRECTSRVVVVVHVPSTMLVYTGVGNRSPIVHGGSKALP